MKDKLKKCAGPAVAFILAIAVIFAAAFYPKPKDENAATERMVRVWNVDTFEGGKGSRTSYLKSAAQRVEDRREGVYYLVSSYTLEGAQTAFLEGRFPDMISFGIGLSAYAEQAFPLPYSFSGGKVGGNTLAYPWCRGEYFLFSLSESFEESGKTAISCGGNNLPQVAAALSGIAGEELPSITAYTRFLSGEYRYLLGTQRDLCRFETRGVSVFYRSLSEYCDLYQYISLLSEEKREDCLALLDELLSSSERMKEIGMFPVEGGTLPKRTAGVFSSEEALSELKQTAQAGDKKNLDKYLKTI